MARHSPRAGLPSDLEEAARACALSLERGELAFPSGTVLGAFERYAHGKAGFEQAIASEDAARAGPLGWLKGAGRKVLETVGLARYDISEVVDSSGATLFRGSSAASRAYAQMLSGALELVYWHGAESDQQALQKCGPDLLGVHVQAAGYMGRVARQTGTAPDQRVFEGAYASGLMNYLASRRPMEAVVASREERRAALLAPYFARA